MLGSQQSLTDQQDLQAHWVVNISGISLSEGRTISYSGRCVDMTSALEYFG